jgi:hypothetical protein
MYIFEHFPQDDVSAPVLRDLAAWVQREGWYAQERIRRVAKLPSRESDGGSLASVCLWCGGCSVPDAQIGRGPM